MYQNYPLALISLDNNFSFVGSTSPSPTWMHKGAMCMFPFSWEKGVFWGCSLGKISWESSGERGCFSVIDNGNQYSSISLSLRWGGGGVQVMGNEHTYPLILGRRGGGGAGRIHVGLHVNNVIQWNLVIISWDHENYVVITGLSGFKVQK